MFACSSVEFCLQHLIYRRLKRAARKGVRRGVKFHKALLGMHCTDLRCSSFSLVPSHFPKSRQPEPIFHAARHRRRLRRRRRRGHPNFSSQGRYMQLFLIYHAAGRSRGLGKNSGGIEEGGGNSLMLAESRVDDKAPRKEQTKCIARM